MSDVFFSGLYAVHEVFMTNCFDEEVSKLITGTDIPRIEGMKNRNQSIARYQAIGSRKRWFHSRVSELLNLSGIDSLRFLSGETYTHQHKVVIESEGQVVWQGREAYTVLNPRYDEVISAIGRLEQWCLSNAEVAGPLLDTRPKDLVTAFDSAFFTLDPTNEGLGDGESAELTFCVLRTIGDVMRFAKFHKCWAVHRIPLDYEF